MTIVALMPRASRFDSRPFICLTMLHGFLLSYRKLSLHFCIRYYILQHLLFIATQFYRFLKVLSTIYLIGKAFEQENIILSMQQWRYTFIEQSRYKRNNEAFYDIERQCHKNDKSKCILYQRKDCASHSYDHRHRKTIKIRICR